MPIIYHITTLGEWNAAKEKAHQPPAPSGTDGDGQGYYESLSLKDEGFIHCSQEHQVAGVLERYFSGKKDLVKLVIDTDKLTSKFVFDWSPSLADTFPHIYGPVNTDAVVDVIAL